MSSVFIQRLTRVLTYLVVTTNKQTSKPATRFSSYIWADVGNVRLFSSFPGEMEHSDGITAERWLQAGASQRWLLSAACRRVLGFLQSTA